MRTRPSCTAAVTVLLATLVAGGCTNAADVRAEHRDLLGFIDPSDPEARLAGFVAEERQVQELIVECMAEAGFEYHPVEPMSDPRLDGSMTEEEYKATYGWGMMSSLRETLLGGGRGDGDPNREIRAAMDSPELLAWESELYGPAETRDDPEVRDGCQAQAEDAVYAYQDTDAWEELRPLLWDLPDHIESHPKTIEANRRWSECMAEKGYQFDNAYDAMTSIDERVFEAWQLQTAPPGEPENDHPYRMHPWFVETDAWAELVEHEMALSDADTACSGDQDVIIEIQEEFLDDHHDLIEQLRTELAERS